jgi:replicative DNA helicase
MVPIIALSQLSRGVEQREEKRPTLSDLRESGSIEQDADIVLFVYREEYYFLLKNPEPDEPAKISEWQTEYDKVKGKAEVLVSKHRHGPTGVVNLAFNKELTSFANLAARHQ